ALTVDAAQVQGLNLDRVVLHTVTVDGVVTWNQETKLETPVAYDTRHMGKTSAISGDTLVVGGEFQSSPDRNIEGLFDEGIYYVGGISGNSFKLFASAADANANNGAGTNPIDFTALGIGTGHQLIRQNAAFDGSSATVVSVANDTIVTAGGYQNG